MQLRTIYDELKSFLMDIEMESDPRLAGNTDLMNYAEVLRSAIANVEAKELVDLTTTSFKTETTTTTLLGIDTEFFDMDEAVRTQKKCCSRPCLLTSLLHCRKSPFHFMPCCLSCVSIWSESLRL
jgi:hypothetical protein